jgi:hypothetical protein
MLKRPAIFYFKTCFLVAAFIVSPYFIFNEGMMPSWVKKSLYIIYFLLIISYVNLDKNNKRHVFLYHTIETIVLYIGIPVVLWLSFSLFFQVIKEVLYG